MPNHSMIQVFEINPNPNTLFFKNVPVFGSYTATECERSIKKVSVLIKFLKNNLYSVGCATGQLISKEIFLVLI